MWEEADICFEDLSCHLSGETEENHEKTCQGNVFPSQVLNLQLSD
jgi:hypothetical protein